ncbi:MAG TPA: guanosine-3',5'-bis(diphosphate) 3'-diphosphatase, partial [Gammaproteobacteria bacterium]|nr:guanosine-3',5'-bis(diphosphate) 3'-diphosphatase [Gammaproteobacteria bacterium]
MTTPLTRRKTHPTNRASAAAGPNRRSLLEELLRDVEDYLEPNEVGVIQRACAFGAQVHAGQQRHSGGPYIDHPLAVAAILANMRLDSHSVTAAILHDVIEDTPVVLDELASEFGHDIAQLVDGVSKIGRIEFDSREHAEAENFRKMLLAMSKDIRVILIKLADRLHNMRTLDSLSHERRKRIS